MTTLPVDQRSRLVSAKLTALVRGHVGSNAAAVPLPMGAGLVDGNSAWILLDRPTPPGASAVAGRASASGLGPALAWAGRHGAGRVAVITDDVSSAAAVARRAATFVDPPAVFAVAGTELVEVAPAPPPEVVAADPAHLEAASLLVEVGADVVVEHGVVVGEVRGLEVARVATIDGVAVVQPGVGRNDRDGHAILLGADVGDDSGALRTTLERVVRQVADHRHGPGADHHPLGRMARSRWLRHEVLGDPRVVGAAFLEPVEPTEQRMSVDEPGVAVAVGATAAGDPLVVACTATTDLDAVPAAADARAVHAPPGARLVLLAPSRALVPATHRLIDRLADPAEVTVVADDWYVGGGVRPYPSA
jgi:hypothetical protein